MAIGVEGARARGQAEGAVDARLLTLVRQTGVDVGHVQ